MKQTAWDNNHENGMPWIRTLTGAVAVMAAAYSLWSADAYLGLAGPFGIPIFLAKIFKVAAMVMCAVFILALYGKRKPVLWGLSAVLMALGGGCLLYVHIYFFIHSSFGTKDIIQVTADALSVIAFILLALKYLWGMKINAIVLTAALGILHLFSVIFFPFAVYIIYDIYIIVNRRDIMDIIFELSHIAPFLMLAVYTKMKGKVPRSPLRKQETLIEGIHLELVNLKKEFENGKVSQREYEYLRKSLIDKL